MIESGFKLATMYSVHLGLEFSVSEQRVKNKKNVISFIIGPTEMRTDWNEHRKNI